MSGKGATRSAAHVFFEWCFHAPDCPRIFGHPNPQPPTQRTHKHTHRHTAPLLMVCMSAARTRGSLNTHCRSEQHHACSGRTVCTTAGRIVPLLPSLLRTGDNQCNKIYCNIEGIVFVGECCITGGQRKQGDRQETRASRSLVERCIEGDRTRAGRQMFFSL